MGGAAAWIGFTLPSALLLFLFAYGAGALSHSAAGLGLLHGLRLLAVAIVAQAVWTMARNLCPDKPRASIAVLALALALLAPTAIGQVAAILLAGLLGHRLCRGEAQMVPEPLHVPVRPVAGALALLAFLLLLALSLWPGAPWAFFNAFYRSGALVFGGGHVVLPLLNQAVVKAGWVSNAAFLAGYGAAQAVPGPLFTFATYLGAAAGGPAGAAVATLAIFLPGLLLQVAALPYWNRLRGSHGGQATLRGVNAGVVGLLAAAFYTPVWTSAILTPLDLALAAMAFVLLLVWKWQPLLVAAMLAAAGVALALL